MTVKVALYVWPGMLRKKGHIFWLKCCTSSVLLRLQLDIVYPDSVSLGLFWKLSLLQAWQVMTMASRINSWLEKSLQPSLPAASKLHLVCFSLFWFEVWKYVACPPAFLETKHLSSLSPPGSLAGAKPGTDFLLGSSLPPHEGKPVVLRILMFFTAPGYFCTNRATREGEGKTFPLVALLWINFLLCV